MTAAVFALAAFVGAFGLLLIGPAFFGIDVSADHPPRRD